MFRWGPLLDLGGPGRLSGCLGALDGFAAPGAAAAMSAAVRPAVSAPASAARAAGEETGKERVELCDSLLGNIDGHLLVLRGGLAWIYIHFALLYFVLCLQEQHITSKYLSKLTQLGDF